MADVLDPTLTTSKQTASGLTEPIELKNTDCGKGILRIIENFEMGDQFARHQQMLKWRKHILYWNSIQYLWESTSAKDWLTVEDLKDDPQSDIDPSMYAKIVNVYKATGEVYIGALTSSTPSVRFFPKDADDEEDVVSSKAFSRITELIQRHNKAQLLLMKAVFILYNQGLVACYNENKTDSRFGQIEIPEYTDSLMMDREHYCPSCGLSQGQESYKPDINAPLPSTPPAQMCQCPNCGYQGQIENEDTPRMTQELTGTTKRSKNREVLEVYGPLNVKIPMWARDQAACPLLILETEESIFLMREIYPEYANQIQAIAAPDNWDRSARVPTNYKGDFPRDLCTVKRCWLRPIAYRYYMEEDDEFVALSKYPDGLYAVIINDDLLCEIVGDKLDDHWTLTEHPLAENLHAEPIGTPMVPLQDITNELANLTLETIEFGIGEVFADTRVLDFDAYQQQEARPGQISPATAPSGMNLAAGFYEMKPATLSREVELFADRMTTTTQYVMGTYPSVYGGTLAEGSNTAREYEMSKSSALQRLSTVWLILQYWWADVMGKATRSFARNMISDESFVKAQGSNFLNVWIRKVELSGDVGDVLPEISEALPVSWTQKRDVLMNLMQMKDPAIAAVLSHPENASMVAALIGLPDLYIPGDDDRNKQLMEIALLITSEPSMGPMGPISSVPITPELDNNAVEAEVCRAWLKSEVGQDAKNNNPAGYANVLAHLKEHLMTMQPPPMPMPSPGPSSAPPEKPNLPPPDHIGDVQPMMS